MKDSGVEYSSNKKHKIVFVLGSTATGKSKLSVDLATFFPSEIINSDKIQFYKGLDIITNKINQSDRRGVPHHLLGVIHEPDADLTAGEFCRLVEDSIADVISRGCLPIVVGGSNNYIEALVENPITDFRSRFDCCFLWTDVALPVLYKYIGKRVDQMVELGLVEEVREMFVPGADYSRGIRRAIGAPELESYFKAEKNNEEETYKKELLKSAIHEIKENTCKLALRQFGKIHRLRDELGWGLHRIDVTAVFEKSGEEAADEWMNAVLKPSLGIVGDFLNEKQRSYQMETMTKNRMGVMNNGYEELKGKWNFGSNNAIGFGLVIGFTSLSLMANWILSWK
ncbi:adenylate isopentenyltransferase 5 [Cucumis melo var. makuwa]|uniref:adenylate dimethylallyltransferase (ADP/ATP-dependent) n=1 Tax=Cucumis melo var. makuwa TaxID=1194695 RepID=A0A5D3CPK4_CUCMM|nr:adenylate isopentenyltransferase 5 [Cucumis melo var. makuwa]TYK13465.1 adenylate isopentenyltransferase 5 [Cucumis melo var. makuwa]